MERFTNFRTRILIFISLQFILSSCQYATFDNRKNPNGSGSSVTAPLAATSLGWVQASPSGTTLVTATWTKSTTASLSNQKIQFYTGSCAATSGPLIDLLSAVTASKTFNGVDGNTYSFKVTSITSSGGTTVSACSPTMIIDTTKPTVVITGPSAGDPANSAGSTTYSFAFSDANLGTVSNASINAALSISGVNTTDCTASASGTGATRTITVTGCSAAAGSASVSISAAGHTDLAGNTLVAAGPSTAFTIDNVAPAAPTVVVVGDEIGTDATPDFTVASLEVGATVQLYSDACVTSVGSTTAGAASITMTSSTITKGSYNFYAKQTDTAGNTSGCTAVPAAYQLSGTPMVSTWQTTVAAETITLPLRGGFTYHALVDWGDGSAKSLITWNGDADRIHSYAAAGSHTVTIMGTMQSWYFAGVGDKDKILSVTELGDLGWTNLSNAFQQCANLGAVDGGITSAVTDMSFMFYYAPNATPSGSTWDTHLVTTMRGMFYGASKANPTTTTSGNIWNLGNVTDFAYMFATAVLANPDTLNWDVHSGTDFTAMFNGASIAQPATQNWNTGNALTMQTMFYNAPLVNPNVLNWDVSKVTDMTFMFGYDTAATPQTQNWNTGEVTNMSFMFYGATNANPNVRNWNTSKVTTMAYMFGGDTAADPDTELWDVSHVTSFTNMFYNCVNANLDGNKMKFWNTSSATNMASMFYLASKAKPETTDWDVSHVTSFASMFNGAVLANPDVSKWQTGAATTMNSMFYQAHSATPVTTTIGPIWDVSNVTDMNYMFGDAQIATPDVGGWNVQNVTSMYGMFYADYAANPDVSAWDVSKVTNFGAMFYAASHAIPNVAAWNTSSATYMRYMFSAAVLANPDVRLWDVSHVTNFSGMFYQAHSAAPDVSLWNVSAATDMGYMFSDTHVADPDVSAWNVANVEDMNNMFSSAWVAHPDLSSWNFAKVANFTNIFYATTQPTANLDATLMRIDATNAKPNLSFHGGSGNYHVAVAGAARADLISRGWTITDGGGI